MEHAGHDWAAMAVHVQRWPGVTEEGGRDAGEERTLGRDGVHGHILSSSKLQRIMCGLESPLKEREEVTTRFLLALPS